MLALDLNNFKEINDTYGHPAGDQVLQEFASCLNQGDPAGRTWRRMGWEATSFSVVLPECTLEQLNLLVLERLQIL